MTEPVTESPKQRSQLRSSSHGFGHRPVKPRVDDRMPADHGATPAADPAPDRGRSRDDTHGFRDVTDGDVVVACPAAGHRPWFRVLVRHETFLQRSSREHRRGH
jgi:hypothetical protein